MSVFPRLEQGYISQSLEQAPTSRGRDALNLLSTPHAERHSSPLTASYSYDYTPRSLQHASPTPFSQHCLPRDAQVTTALSRPDQLYPAAYPTPLPTLAQRAYMPRDPASYASFRWPALPAQPFHTSSPTSWPLPPATPIAAGGTLHSTLSNQASFGLALQFTEQWSRSASVSNRSPGDSPTDDALAPPSHRALPIRGQYPTPPREVSASAQRNRAASRVELAGDAQTRKQVALEKNRLASQKSRRKKTDALDCAVAGAYMESHLNLAFSL